jgi:hypothetical protein
MIWTYVLPDGTGMPSAEKLVIASITTADGHLFASPQVYKGDRAWQVVHGGTTYMETTESGAVYAWRYPAPGENSQTFDRHAVAPLRDLGNAANRLPDLNTPRDWEILVRLADGAVVWHSWNPLTRRFVFESEDEEFDLPNEDEVFRLQGFQLVAWLPFGSDTHRVRVEITEKGRRAIGRGDQAT